MNFALRFARHVLFLLIALVGVGLLALGWFDCQRFFAELYREEMAAIGAAVDAGLEVEYRRAGEPRTRTALRRQDWLGQSVETSWDKERKTVPDNAAFLGRVESVVVRSPRYASAPPPTRAIRDGLLRLPGMKAYESLADDYAAADPSATGGVDASGIETPSASSSSKRTLEQALASSLPDLPAAKLTVEEATAPLPRGTRLPSAERESLASEIADAWARKSGPDAYVARASWHPGADVEYELLVTEVADGTRFASSVEQKNPPSDPEGAVRWGYLESLGGNLRLVEGQQGHAFDQFDESWVRRATIARNDDAKPSPRGRRSQPDRFAPVLLAPRSVPRIMAESQRFAQHALPPISDATAPGPHGENVAVIERIDDERLRVELASGQAPEFGEMSVYIEMIVRQDLHFAVERYLARLATPVDGNSRKHRFEVHLARRLATVEDAVYATETLRVERAFESGPIEPHRPPPEERRERDFVERTRQTVVAVPELPGAAFDPRTYDPTPWPEPRELPSVRSYRALWSAGGVFLAIGLVGPLFARRRSSRKTDAAVEGEPATTSGQCLPRFRFGFVALFAAALGLISVAGAVKQLRDEVERDVDRVRKLDAAAQFERREPRFPRSLFSTPGFPLDAPVKRIVVSGVSEDDEAALATEAIDALLASPDLDSFLDASQEDDPLPREDVLGEAAKALDRALPPLPEPAPAPNVALWLEALPEGEALEEAERAAFVERMFDAWRAMRERVPRRWLLVERHEHYGPPEERVTLGDGDRVWSLGGRMTASVTTQDDAYRYRFRLTNDAASLIERSRIGTSPMTWSVFPDVALYGMATPMYGAPRMLGEGVSLFTIERPGRLPDPPYAFPQPLYVDIEGFETVVAAALDPANVRSVARLDETRVRIDFAPIEVELPQETRESGNEFEAADDDLIRSLNQWDDGAWAQMEQPTPSTVAVTGLTIVVREDLDFAVEQSWAETQFPRPNVRTGGDFLIHDPSSRRKSYLTNRLVRSESGLVVPEVSRVGDDLNGSRTWWDSRYGYDLAPEIDERIFASPSMADLQPIPTPERRWPVTWPLFTGAVSLALLVGLGARRLAGRLRPKRASNASDAR